MMAHTSYQRMFKDNFGGPPLKTSEAPFGNQRVRSPVTEHAYLKVDSILSHGDEHVNTYGLMSG